jgi:hypothetical protein
LIANLSLTVPRRPDDLTDGGHIENLGVYELLRQGHHRGRCRGGRADEFLGADDAAALRTERPRYHHRSAVGTDPGTDARIDEPQFRQGRGAGAIGRAGKPNRDFPHVAIGSIDYGAGEKGHFVCIKSSLTGQKNDYVRDHARRHDSFPHETTGDQFFSEDQFEVYRALGFHMAHGFLSGQCKVVTGPRTGPSSVKFAAGGGLDRCRTALGLL